MNSKRITVNGWQLSTLILLGILLGLVLARFTGVGFASAQGGGEAKVQLDTSNCRFDTETQYAAVPQGAFVVQVVPTQNGKALYVYDICR